MRFKHKELARGMKDKKKQFAILPISIGWETRWWEMVYWEVEWHYYDGWYTSPTRFIAKEEYYAD